MTDETMTLEQVRDGLRRIGAHPNSLFSRWERAIESAIAERKVADGWQLVPIEPTMEMLNGARDWSVRKNGMGVGNDQATGCYTAMLAAAPKVTP